MDSDSSHTIEVAVASEAWLAAVTEPEAICRRVITAVLDCEAVGPSEVSVVLADDGFITGLNRDYRGLDRPTKGIVRLDVDLRSDDEFSYEYTGTLEAQPVLWRPIGDTVIDHGDAPTTVPSADDPAITLATAYGDAAHQFVPDANGALLGNRYDHELANQPDAGAMAP